MQCIVGGRGELLWWQKLPDRPHNGPLGTTATAGLWPCYTSVLQLWHRYSFIGIQKYCLHLYLSAQKSISISCRKPRIECTWQGVYASGLLLWIMVNIDVTISELENSNAAHCHWTQSGKFVKGPFFSGHYARLLSGRPAAVYTGSQKVRYRAVTVPSSSGRCHSSPDT